MLTFNNGRLSWISRSWGSFSNEAHDFGEALYGVLESATKEYGETAIVTAETGRLPGMTISSIHIAFGNKNIILLISSGKEAGNTIGIQETLK
jgi:hypothetical protein